MIDWAELGGSTFILPDHRRDRERRLQELARDVVGAAYLRGEFVLSSGVTSTYYFDKYLFETKPGILRRIASFLAEVVPPLTDRIAGTELGAVALATALSLETGLPFVIARKGMKTYSTARLVEGELYPGEHVVVIEDVVSTGAQAIRAADSVVRAGAQVVGILAVIDREQGGADAISAAGYALTSLFSRSQLGV
jgi:orotate phosphoribosyltransferase